ncbi:MAG TPA: trypsin-like serine protease [Bacteriovoracaceae bacterium]|nr:trypsin-like serine protease [Bacteriovoracaceae bacterium]
MIKPLIGLIFSIAVTSSFADPGLINGKPVGDLFRGVGTFNGGCTITKVGSKQFITAAHCVSSGLNTLRLTFKDHRGTVNVQSLIIHPSWLKDCVQSHCDGTEVGSSRMTPGRSDVAFINVREETALIPVINVRFSPLPYGTEVAMVGAGCTRGVEPGGASRMRYATTQTISPEYLVHEHSLYRKIAEITGQSNWVTPGYGESSSNASLCPGDSGGPMLTKSSKGDWEICGIAADYTFDGPYQDGNITVTNLHTRLDVESYHNVGDWIRDVWVDLN